MNDEQKSLEPQVENPEKEAKINYIDLDQIKFSDHLLLFFRKKLDEFAIQCFIQVIKKIDEGGLNKTKIDNYTSQRKRYDASFLILESQGFIEQKQSGTSKPYFVTIRGYQLFSLLKREIAAKKESKH